MRFDWISVYPAFSNEMVVEWALTEATVPGNYLFRVYRADNPEGPWTLLTTVPIVNDTYFIDRDVPVLTKESIFYYKVVAENPKGRVVESSPKDMLRNLEAHQWRLLKEITRKEILRFRKFVGIKAYVLKRKHFGTKCSTCVDPISGVQVRSFCESCYGTSICGGYYTPIEAWIEIAPVVNDKTIRPDGFGMAENQSTQVRVVSYPLITAGDILCEADMNRRYHVRAIQPFEVRGVPVVQLVTVSHIARSDVEYKIPIQPVVVP